MGLISDVFGEKKKAKPATARSRQERIDDEIRKAKAAAGREVLRNAEREAERDPVKGRMKRGMIKEARLQLRNGDETGAAATLTRAMGKRWGNKLRSAVKPRVTRTRKKKKPATTGGGVK